MLLETVASDAFPTKQRIATFACAVRTGYRPDIDGLRAIAVLAVVFTHAGVAGFGGGYVGVDVFFVISGFLIARNLAGASRAGRLGFLTFYGRRVRRTLPALYAVACATLVAGAVLLLPGEFDDLAQSLAALLLFVPNILFLTQAGYFDQAAIAKPFLHSWSLGVEEHFYLIAPLLPLLLRSVGRRWGQGALQAALLGLFGLAFAFCLNLRASSPDAAFYLMPARLWEFLAGCIVAENILPPVRARWLAEGLALAALTGLAAAIRS